MLLCLTILSVFCISGAMSDCPVALKSMLNENLKTNVENGCGADWQYFARPSGGWCMKVFAGEKTFADAEKVCNSAGATLSGMQNAVEIDFIQAATLATISQSSSSVLIGMKRTDKCLKQKLTATCTAKTSFEWTDGSASGTDGFVFLAGQPDNSVGNANCAVLLAASTPTVTAGAVYKAKTLDDVPCTLAPGGTSPRAIRAFVCGKKASK